MPSKFGFNSIMVRLRPAIPIKFGSGIRFQFQYGAIKTLVKIGLHGNAHHISIPIWCD